MILITDVRPGETDILQGNDTKPLEIRSLDERVLKIIEPTTRWNHETLVAVVDANQAVIDAAYGAEAYLGDQFIGSTEI